MEFPFFRKKVYPLCSACRKEIKGTKGSVFTFCDHDDINEPVYAFHSECVSPVDIGKAVSSKTVSKMGWTPFSVKSTNKTTAS